MEVLEKHWGTSAVFGVDFSERLATGETLSSGAALTCVDALDGGSTSDLTISSVSISGTKVVGTISGGICLDQVNETMWRCRYSLMAVVTTSASERETECVQLVVYDCETQAAIYT